jgi:hypothetical protein
MKTQRAPVPSAPPAGCFRSRVLQIREDRCQEEECAQDVAPFRRPRHRLHAERMHSEQERGECRAKPHSEVVGEGVVERQRDQALRDQVDEAGVRGVQQEAGQVIPDRVHPPDEIVEAEGHPSQGDVETHERGGPHPAELRPAHAAIERVLRQIVGVVPVDEVGSESGQERGEREGRDDQQKSQVVATAARLMVFPSATRPGHRPNPLTSPALCPIERKCRPAVARPGADRSATVHSKTIQCVDSA